MDDEKDCTVQEVALRILSVNTHRKECGEMKEKSKTPLVKTAQEEQLIIQDYKYNDKPVTIHYQVT